MEEFIKEFKKDIIFYGVNSCISNEREMRTSTMYAQETLICEQGKIIYWLRKFPFRGQKSTVAAVIYSSAEEFLRLPVREIEKLINAAIFYNEVIAKVEEELNERLE